MTKAAYLQTNFTAGEISPRLDARPDIAKYKNGCKTLENFVVMPHGGARKRGGTQYVCTAKNGASKKIRLIPFEFSSTQSYVLEFGDQYMRVMKDRGQVLTGGGSVYELATTYLEADLPALSVAQSFDVMYIAHSSYPLRKLARLADNSWTISDVAVSSGPFRSINGNTALTIAISGTASGYGTIAPGTTVTLTAASAVFDPLHVGCLWRFYEPAKTAGVAAPATGAAISNGKTYTLDAKVYGMNNITGTGTFYSGWSYPKHTTGAVVVADTGGTIKYDAVYLHDSKCVIQITGYTSATVVTGIVVGNRHVPATAIPGTSFWEEGAWSYYRGFPRVITFHEQRLWAAGTSAQPQTVWASKTGAFEDFGDGVENGDAIVYDVASGKSEIPKWMDQGRTLVLGTASSEFAILSSNQNEALTPKNVNIRRQTPYGSSDARPVRVGSALLFVERFGKGANAGRKVREFIYSYQEDSYVAPDMTIISEHITGTGIAELAFQNAPDRIAWMARSDGYGVGLTYEREQQVTAWHRHFLGGRSTVGGAVPVIENLCVIPGDKQDDLYMTVLRYMNGAQTRYIEVLTPGMTDDQVGEDAVFVDCALTYRGAATSSISGLTHLAGETVSIWANGARLPDQVVSGGGTLTLPQTVTVATFGYRYQSVLETLSIEAGAQAGTAQARAQRAPRAFLNISRSLGGRVGIRTPEYEALDDLAYREGQDLMASAPPLYTGYIGVNLPGGWERGVSVRIEHDDPSPFTVLGIVTDVTTTG